MPDEDVNDIVTVDPDGQHETLLRKAYEGEIIGEAMYARLGDLADTEYRRRAARLAAEVERVTANLLLPLMERHAVDSDRERAWRIGLDFTNESIEAGWSAYFEKVAPLAKKALVGMKKLHEISDEADRDATGRLVAHEEALLEFVRRELEGAADAVAPLEDYLADQRTHG